MRLVVSVVMACLLVSGCAGHMKLTRDSQGRITEAKCSRGSSCSYDAEDAKVSIDSKMKSPLEGLVTLGPRLGK